MIDCGRPLNLLVQSRPADNRDTRRLDATGTSFVNQGQVRAKASRSKPSCAKGESRALRATPFSAPWISRRMKISEFAASRRKSAHQPAGPWARSFVSLEAHTSAAVRLFRAKGVRCDDSQRDLHSTARTIPGALRWHLERLQRQLFDPVSDQHLQDAIPQNGRTARIGLTWNQGRDKRPPRRFLSARDHQSDLNSLGREASPWWALQQIDTPASQSLDIFRNTMRGAGVIGSARRTLRPLSPPEILPPTNRQRHAAPDMGVRRPSRSRFSSTPQPHLR